MHHDPEVTCPYCYVSMIERARMAYHLHKCAQNFPFTKKKQCPFNALHRPDEMEYSVSYVDKIKIFFVTFFMKFNIQMT